jgi:ABC-type nitrate/sulfonate/bicarbonate transport system substrate-binding protein
MFIRTNTTMIQRSPDLALSGNARLLPVLALGLLLASLGCSRQSHNGDLKSVRRVTIGIQVSPAMTLVMVAKDEGFFSQQGLDVDLKEFTAGKFALQAFLGGSIDFAVSGDVPVCLAALQGNQIRVVAQVVDKTADEVRVVALKDRGTKSSIDPGRYFKSQKRRLATSFGGGPEFFTYNFLRHYKIEPNEIEVLSQRPEDMTAALATHSVDAISIFDPFAFIAEKQLGDKAVTFTGPGVYSELYVLDARPEQIEKSPEVIEALLRALVQAETFIAQNPDKSKQIMQKYTKLDREVIDGIWGSFSFKAALGQKLLDYWNAEAIWARDTTKVRPDTKIPDFKRFVDSRFLKSVNPGAVKL